MSDKHYNFIETENGAPIKAWTKGVLLDDRAKQQLANVAKLPFVFRWVAAMPDVHWGNGGERDPDQGRDHPGRGRRGYRLRHDGGPNQPQRTRSAREPEEHSR